MSDLSRETPPAIPKYRVDQRCQYRDREGRIQQGRVKRIEAKWHGWGKGPVDPLMTYTMEHPTYRNNVFYCGDAAILRPLTPRELEGYRYE